MRRSEGVRCLELAYHGFLDDNVCKETADALAVVVNGQRALAQRVHADTSQLDKHCAFVDGLEKSVAKLVVSFIEGIQDLPCRRSMQHGTLSDPRESASIRVSAATPS